MTISPCLHDCVSCHLLPAALAPSLAFIGLPWRVVPFPMFELQAKLCARWVSTLTNTTFPLTARLSVISVG